MTTFRKEALFVIAVMALAMLFWNQTSLIPESATTFPKILIVAIAGFSLAMLAQAWITAQKNIQKESSEPINYVRILLFASILLIYVFSVQPLGYFIVTPLFIIVTSILFKALSVLWSFAVAIVFSSFIYALFVGFLHLPVPLGLLESVLGV